MKWAVVATVAVLVAITFNVALPAIQRSDDPGVRSEEVLRRAFTERGAELTDIDCERRTCSATDGAGRDVTCTVTPGRKPSEAVSCSRQR